MNRIILIGNGFDLAHGLKTSYADFIDWYWDKWGERLKTSSNRVESDELCSFKLKDFVEVHSWYLVWDFLLYKRKPQPYQPWSAHDAVVEAKQNGDICKLTFQSDFFKEICQQVEEKKWVDIENIYYSHLCKDNTDPKLLNKQFAIIRKKLIEYLKEVQKGISESMVKKEIMQKMTASFSIREISVNYEKEFSRLRTEFWRSRGKNATYAPERTILLNFNYTTLADLYFKGERRAVTHIHGDIYEPNSVIFGYGDELDEKYKTLVNKNENEYLRNVKSVKYLENFNYRRILEFIEAAPFQIFIMGHSCGNSDRTLLNTLFEHRNCVSIKPFYYIKDDGSDNYIELVQNISRNFTDMKLMRNRVVNKEFCEPLLSKDTTQSNRRKPSNPYSRQKNIRILRYNGKNLFFPTPFWISEMVSSRFIKNNTRGTIFRHLKRYNSLG